ncbi:hypothetical protein ABPG74_007510 [Tetrahymena malaccensis]
MKKIANLLIFITFLGFALSNIITLPLIQSQKDGLVVNVKYGTQECSKNMRVQNYYFCTTQLRQDPEHDNCGVTKMDYDENFEGYDYNAQLILDATQFNMKITIPDYVINYYNQNVFCLAPTINVRNSSNPVVELYNQKLIQNQQFYFYIKDLTYTNPIDTVVGAMHIGQPDMSVVKPGSKVYQLRSHNDNNNFSISGSKKFRYDGESITFSYTTLKLSYGYYLSYFTNSFTIDCITFDGLIKVFKKKGLKFTQKQKYEIYFQSLEGLGNFEFDLHLESGQYFTVTFTPEEMTALQQDGTYYLRMTESIGTTASIGYQIFNKYYIGFNLDGYSQLIAERADHQAQQS